MVEAADAPPPSSTSQAAVEESDSDDDPFNEDDLLQLCKSPGEDGGESDDAKENSKEREEAAVESVDAATKPIAADGDAKEASVESDDTGKVTTEVSKVTEEVTVESVGSKKESLAANDENKEAKLESASDSALTAGKTEDSATDKTRTSELPDHIARLPPKLRERLLKRGILKENDLRAPPKAEVVPKSSCPPPNCAPLGTPPTASLGTPPTSAAPGTPPAVVPGTPPINAPGTPPETDQTPGALCKAAPPPAGSLSKAAPPPAGSLCKAAPQPLGSLRKAATPAGPVATPGLSLSAVADLQAQMQDDLRALQEKRRVAWLEAMNRQAELDAELEQAKEQTLSASASAKKKPEPPKTVYSSAPVINKGTESTSEGKEQEVQSPANLRAAAAKAESAASPVWVYKDGVVIEMNGNKSRKVEKENTTPKAGVPAPGAAVATTVVNPTEVAAVEMAMPPPPGPPPGPPLPAGWVRVPHEGDFYFWNTSTNEVSWEHPSTPKAAPEQQVFKEEHRILWSDLGKVIGRQGINLKIIKESIGCSVNVPRQGKGKGKDDGKDGKGKAKGKNKGKKDPDAIRGAGTGATPIPDDAFVTVSITADDAHKARGGKRCLEVMLGYGKRVEAALEALGVQAKYPKLADEVKGGPGDKPKDEIDPMDPSSYSDAPQGGWSRGIPKPGAGGRSSGGGPEPRDSKTANAERF